MDKISSLQSLSDYGLGDSDIEDSDDENEEESSANAKRKYVEQPRLPRVVSASSRLVSYGEEDEEEEASKVRDVESMVVEELISKSPFLVQDNEEISKETETKEINEKDANENDVVDEIKTSDLRFIHPNVVLPPEPAGRCSNSLQNKIASSLESKKRNRTDFNAKIQKMKDFRNPSIYEKLVSYLKIQENGTNYPKDLYDPDAWAKEPNYEILAKQQKEAYEKKEKEKAKRTQIQFLSGTKKVTTEITTASVEEAKKRKSKWDISVSTTSAPVITNPVLAKAISDATASAVKKAKS